MAVLASPERKTTLIFPPLPLMENSSDFKLMSLGREQSSETRSPVEKNNSKIARSLNPFSSLVSGALIKRLSSSGVMRSSDLSPTFANSIRSGDKVLMFRRIIYLRNERRAIR